MYRASDTEPFEARLFPNHESLKAAGEGWVDSPAFIASALIEPVDDATGTSDPVKRPRGRPPKVKP